jgi:outer membrane protein OmpA-like peptidoglycan-associated protein
MKHYFKLIYGILLLSTNLFAQQGLVGEYYDGEHFQQLIGTKVDAKIDFNWGYDAPMKGMSPEHFSIKWHGNLVAPTTGEYQFSVKVDDGIRLWVNEQPMINAWGLNDASQFSNKIYLEKGKSYPIRVEYYNGMLNSLIHLYWKTPENNGWFSKPSIVPSSVYQQQQAAKPQVKEIPKPVEKKQKPIEQTKAKVEKPKPQTTPAPTTNKAQEEAIKIEKIKQVLEPTFIYFVKGTNELLPQSKQTLDEWVNYLKELPNKSIAINGYTDNLGDAKMNLTLSEERAKVVKNYLINQGIATNRLTTNGFGGENAIYKTPKNEEERRLNRRVEIRLKNN